MTEYCIVIYSQIKSLCEFIRARINFEAHSGLNISAPETKEKMFPLITKIFLLRHVKCNEK